MKKSLSILVLLCLLLNVVGYHIIFRLKQAETRAEMKRDIRAGLYSKEQTVFSFPIPGNEALARVDWEENGQEFSLDGKMYDVIEKKMDNGRLVIRCISDERETNLLKKFEKINNETSGSAKGKTALLLKLLSSPYVASAKLALVISGEAFHEKSLFISGNPSAAFSEIVLPPPQLS